MMEAVHRYEGTHAIARALGAAHHGTGCRAEGVVLMEEAARGAGPAPAPGPLSRRRRRCSARWTCASGSSRRRERWPSWREAAVLC
jgi:hypothetical protein